MCFNCRFQLTMNDHILISLTTPSTAKNAKWIPLTESPLTKKYTMDQLQEFRDTPFSTDYPSHTQSAEHGVAAVSKAVKQRRTERTQLIQVRQAVAAIKKCPGPIRKKRKLGDD